MTEEVHWEATFDDARREHATERHSQSPIPEYWPITACTEKCEQSVASVPAVASSSHSYSSLNETIRGHVFCSFLALVLKVELKQRIAALARRQAVPTHSPDTDVCEPAWKQRARTGPSAPLRVPWAIRVHTSAAQRPVQWLPRQVGRINFLHRWSHLCGF
jgi:hypothetical protein